MRKRSYILDLILKRYEDRFGIDSILNEYKRKEIEIEGIEKELEELLRIIYSRVYDYKQRTLDDLDCR